MPIIDDTEIEELVDMAPPAILRPRSTVGNPRRNYVGA
jgi:hypothetical protein